MDTRHHLSTTLIPKLSCDNILCPNSTKGGMEFCTKIDITAFERWGSLAMTLLLPPRIKVSMMMITIIMMVIINGGQCIFRDCCCFPVSEQLSLVAGVICVLVSIRFPFFLPLNYDYHVSWIIFLYLQIHHLYLSIIIIMVDSLKGWDFRSRRQPIDSLSGALGSGFSFWFLIFMESHFHGTQVQG